MRKAGAQVNYEPPETPIVTDITFQGDLVFSEENLRLRVRSVANRELLGWTGIRWWLGLYRLGEKVGKRLGRALMAAGEPPAFLDSSLVAADADRLRLYYQQEGYRNASVVGSVVQGNSPKHVSIVFHVQPGAPTFIRRVNFEGLDALDPQVARRLADASILRHQRGRMTSSLSFRAQRERYSESRLLAERRRLLAALLDRGYAAVTRDSIRAIVFPVHTDSFDVRFRIRTGRRYRFGDLEYVVTGPETRDSVRRDTVRVDSPSVSDRPFFVTSTLFSERKLSHNLLHRSMAFQPGDWYNQSLLNATKRRLESSGVFAFTDVQPLFADTTGPEAPTLPHQIELRTRQRHQIRLETFVLQRTGLLGKTDADLGMGFGITYRNNNLFGEGEALQLRGTTSVAADSDFKLFRSTQGEVEASLNFPYLIAPFGGLGKLSDFYDLKSRISLSLIAARRDELRLILRGRGSARVRLEFQHAPTVTSVLDVLDITVSNPDTLEGFTNNFLRGILGAISDPVQQARILEDYTKPQINNAFRYTLVSSNVNPLRRERGHYFEALFEIGGNLPALMDRLVFSPDTVEGSLPGLPFFGGSNQTRLIYRQYLRFIGDFRQYRRLNRNLGVAWKAVVGVAHPIGRSEVVPFDKRFFSGGSFSVRGWGLGELGPGASSLTTEDATAEANLFGGDIKLEFSVELRRVLFRNVFAADWIVTPFVDAGNVWFGPRNPGIVVQSARESNGRFRASDFVTELGVGTGVGVRWAWEYFIARLDFAYKVHDPQTGEFFPDPLRRPRLHFGIGHTF